MKKKRTKFLCREKFQYCNFYYLIIRKNWDTVEIGTRIIKIKVSNVRAYCIFSRVLIFCNKSHRYLGSIYLLIQ